MTNPAQPNNEADFERLQRMVRHLEAAHSVSQSLGKILDLAHLTVEITDQMTRLTGYRRALLLVLDDNETALKFGAVNQPNADDTDLSPLQELVIDLFAAEYDPLLRQWLDGIPSVIAWDDLDEQSPIRWLLGFLQAERAYSLPLLLEGRLIGVLILDQHQNEQAETNDQNRLVSFAPIMVIPLENARIHTRTMDTLASKMRELYILRQIDRELSDTIQLEHVFSMTLDWGIRYTNGHAASLALYDEDTDELRYIAEVGYGLSDEQLKTIRAAHTDTTMHRVARNGRPEIIPDVSVDPGYMRLSGAMQSQLVAPILRNDHVIAVIAIESKKLNAFSDEQVDFIEKLGARAGVAIDNARLFAETLREREKLSRILRNIADAVIVVGVDANIQLINQAAVSALMLDPDVDYSGQPFGDVFASTELLALYQRAIDSQQVSVGEIQTSEERSFYASLSPSEGVGWIIVLHDITSLKETDRLKSELVATVSHDLKQPLSVMHGYTELLSMAPRADTQILNYTRMIQRSIGNMRQLIDDLLDLAKIEAGIQFTPQPVSLRTVIDDCLTNIKPTADQKAMQLTAELPETLPLVRGVPRYLSQIFINLVSNAVKYTPERGTVQIWSEYNNAHVRVAVQDNGFGISPEDQARIFERFYRVRRPETDAIDGTGLGLAIVKKLVEAHDGHIGLDSEIGRGTTFYVTLPVYTDDESQN